MYCIKLNNHPLPTKCKYLGHIITNSLTDDDDIARPKRRLHSQANVLARTFCLCSTYTKITLFQAYCGPMYISSLWGKLKNLSLKSITITYSNSLRILLNLPSRCSTMFMFATNYIKSFNKCIRSSIFSLLYHLKTLYLSISFILIYIFEARCTHTGYPCCTHNIVLYFYTMFYN